MPNESISIDAKMLTLRAQQGLPERGAEMGQEPDPTMTLQAFEQILPELKKISEQQLKPEEIRAELEGASKSDLVEHYLKLIEQHFDVIRAFVALAEATGKVLKSDEQTTE